MTALDILEAEVETEVKQTASLTFLLQALGLIISIHLQPTTILPTNKHSMGSLSSLINAKYKVVNMLNIILQTTHLWNNLALLLSVLLRHF